jgi:NAD(P)-dependent dehydrogenase (short-subunit alcohol dehydrogenase family)
MDELDGRVAVVTGGAGGIGRALGARLAREGMSVVLADVEPDALDAAVDALRAEGLEVSGETCNVAEYDSVVHLRDATLRRYGAVHLLCNNAGIGAGAEGALWEHELNDWRWAFNVNVYGVIHGINAFVPTMVASGSAVGASVLFPGPNMLRTGIFSSWRVRPPELAKERPRRTPYPTIEDIEAQMAAAGIEVNYTEPEDVADQVVRGVRAGDFWIMAPSPSIDARIRARSASMLERSNPTYLREVPG